MTLDALPGANVLQHAWLRLTAANPIVMATRTITRASCPPLIPFALQPSIEVPCMPRSVPTTATSSASTSADTCTHRRSVSNCRACRPAAIDSYLGADLSQCGSTSARRSLPPTSRCASTTALGGAAMDGSEAPLAMASLAIIPMAQRRPRMAASRQDRSSPAPAP
jgi:hypothetical protein